MEVSRAFGQLCSGAESARSCGKSRSWQPATAAPMRPLPAGESASTGGPSIVSLLPLSGSKPVGSCPRAAFWL
jgi:hypothetical protein